MKKKTPQVQVKLPGSCNVFYLFFDFYWYFCIEKYLLRNGGNSDLMPE